MKYKITLANQIRALRSLIVGTVIYSGTIYYLYNKYGYDPTMFLVLVIYYLVLLVPTLWVHIEYYLLNKNDVVFISSTEQIISFNDQKDVDFSQLENITLFMGLAMYRNSDLRISSFANYHYAVIKTANGPQFIFTNLMAIRIELVLKDIKGVSIERKIRFIPSPSLHKLWDTIWN